jgi:hypothetical protein
VTITKEEIVESTPLSVSNISQDEAHTYTDINNVPVPWRTYKSVRLNLNQINEIISNAYLHPIETETGNIPDYGKARAEFAATHHVEDGFWVKGESE